MDRVAVAEGQFGERGGGGRDGIPSKAVTLHLELLAGEQKKTNKNFAEGRVADNWGTVSRGGGWNQAKSRGDERGKGGRVVCECLWVFGVWAWVCVFVPSVWRRSSFGVPSQFGKGCYSLRCIIVYGTHRSVCVLC